MFPNVCMDLFFILFLENMVMQLFYLAYIYNLAYIFERPTLHYIDFPMIGVREP